MTTAKTKNDSLATAIQEYGEAAQAASKQTTNAATVLGFGAVMAAGMFTASEADATIVYSGPLNAGFAMSTVNASSTNAISPPLTFSSLNGAVAFGIAGNNRGPLNAVGSTDILWAVGAGYLGGAGGVIANGPSFPATASALVSSAASVPGSPPGSAASLAWAAAGAPGNMAIDAFGVGSSGSVNGFFGFTFASTGGGTLNGWAQINITSAGGLPTGMTLIDWAYQDDGSSIHVGNTGAMGAPEPATTGLIALGLLAAGASGMRRRRSATAS